MKYIGYYVIGCYAIIGLFSTLNYIKKVGVR